MFKLPIGVDINNLIENLRFFSWEASDILLYYSQIIKNSRDLKEIINNENYEDPTTLADLKVNDLIIKRINENYKNVNWDMLSEENVKIQAKDIETKSQWMWVLDPLDGTKDFIQGTSDYAMHLALNFEHKPYIGAVLIPARGELWLADGKKTWCETKVRSAPKLNVYSSKTLQDMTIVTSKNHKNDTLKNLINEIGFRKVNEMGSIGCKIASILKGESDIYICLSLQGKSSPKDWDFAAPEAILKAAGGAITNIDNEELCYGSKNYRQDGIIIASGNKQTHRDICLQIKSFILKNDLYTFNS